MEPADLNSSASTGDDARLSSLLRHASPALPDDGFSSRVLTALPAAEPKSKSPTSLRLIVCLVGALAGCSLAVWQAASSPDLRSGLSQIENSTAQVLAPLTDPAFSAAVVVATLSLLFAFRSELRSKLLS